MDVEKDAERKKESGGGLTTHLVIVLLILQMEIIVLGTPGEPRELHCKKPHDAFCYCFVTFLWMCQMHCETQ